MTPRLVSLGNVIIDLVITVPALPERGADVLADSAEVAPGGSFNTMVAAVRQGLPADYGGAHGTGPFGDRVRAGLVAEGIEVLNPPTPGVDTGYDVAMIDAEGERTFVTVFGAEATLTAAAVSGIRPAPLDLVHLSGYGLLTRTNAAVIAPWVARLGAGPTVLVDPGPLVADIPPETWRAVVRRADWLSCNAREATIIAGLADAADAARALAMQLPGVLVRLGPDGCLLAVGGEVRHLVGYPVSVVDTNGAGDAHTGAFLAALAAGQEPVVAARRANACAALAVTRRGPSTAPTAAEVDALLASSTCH